MVSGSGDNEVYLQQVIAELQALIRQNGAASQAMIAELQQVKAELEDLRSRTRLRDGTNG
jgi:chaperonin cofactor prefoldin